MTAPPPAPPPVAQKGVAAEAMRLFGSITQHFQTLLALAGVEGREAAALYIRLAIVLGAALFFAVFGYIFLILFLAFAIVAIFHVEWLWVTLGFTVLHLLGAVVGALYLKARFRTPIFRGTLEEIRKDTAALRGSANTPSAP